MLIRQALAAVTIAGAASLAVLVPPAAQAAAPPHVLWTKPWGYYPYSPLCEQAGATLMRQGRVNDWSCIDEGSKGWGLHDT
ncbi:hypothetical protein ABGB18_05560 [Nonomuraea sp. B12E4]|uniref:hypothetical protein n=1 Tax=Nonomuraea sp. B12E4 TaxID=3153564 RepID=UPI00325F681C